MSGATASCSASAWRSSRSACSVAQTRGRWPRLAITCPAENLTLSPGRLCRQFSCIVYSYFSEPIFGPPRYHLFIAPAYLILLAHGLARLPTVIRWPLVAVGAVLSLSLLQNYHQSLKADWRGLATWIETREANTRAGDSPRASPTILVHPSDPRFPREQVEAARYYLSPRFRVVPAGERSAADTDLSGPTYEVHCLSGSNDPGKTDPAEQEFYGLRVKSR